MYLVSTFYLSRILGRRIYGDNDVPLGRIHDLVVDLAYPHPKVTAIILTDGRAVDSSSIDVIKDGGQYLFYCHEVSDVKVKNENILYLSKNVQDRQIVDTDGRKVVRVNDLRLAIAASGIYLIAVDVGMEGLLRRLGVAKPIKKVLKSFHKSIPSKLILWDDVEAVDVGQSGIKLSKESSKLLTLHPSDVADIIEELDRSTQNTVFASFDEERAADVLEEMEPDAQINIIESMSVAKAADVLEKMPSDEVADILDKLHGDRAEKILKEMNREASDEVRELMEYPEDTVGSVMSTDFVTFNIGFSVRDVLAELRRQKPELDSIYYLYIVDDSERLLATVSLRDLVISDPSTQISEIMNTKFISVYDHDDIETLNEIVSKYNLLAVPVTDKNDFMLGIVVINDVVYNLLRTNRKRI